MDASLRFNQPRTALNQVSFGQRFGFVNPLMAFGYLSAMMTALQAMMEMMGGELPGTFGFPGASLMSARNPMFGFGPACGNGMENFLGGQAPAPTAPKVRGPRGSAAPRTVSEQVHPGTKAMLERAGTMVGMHGDRDAAELKKITRLGPSKHAWCAAYAMNMLEQHGVLNLDGLKNRNYCPTIEKWARDKGIYGTPDKYVPKPGDAILFDWEGKGGSTDHIGIVEKVENGMVHTIEGNKGNKVNRRVIPLDDKRIDGYVITSSK